MINKSNLSEDSFIKRTVKVKKKPNHARDAFMYLKYSNVGIAVVVPIFLGLTIGVWLDTLFATKPAITGFALVVGVVACFYQLYKLTKRET